ncbi:KAP family P-loop NTPase fold protein [Pseudomonas sp. UBA1879]|uniref:KAP family P-loop NTPase fold protein n=1 Tax=Pseudomonas sp. UBA1879 TaxID=1947305 RepID=UPI0025CD289B|nr:KAP family NTPase [Pseudomonas sp. UBA1879]
MQGAEESTRPDSPELSPLNADRPVAAPDDDAFGYYPFAKSLAEAIRKTPSPAGVVMALNGPWGSGKSSLLNLIKYDLRQCAEAQPVIIEFNPWWFNGRDQLAGQLLTQFHKALIGESGALRDAGDMLADYASTISKAVTYSTSIPWLDTVLTPLLKRLGRKPVDVPKVKVKISKTLEKSDRRVLIIIDDIDRLTPPEMLEVFKVVKALGDFPNVLYLLSFDRDVVAEAIGGALSAGGLAYLEKIVQAAFELPAISQSQLNAHFSQELNKLISAVPTPDAEPRYFQNIFFDGLEHYLQRPRDIVRVMNVLRVTFPAVAGEVNWVDFVALEFLRIFEPVAYHRVRNHSRMFTGSPGMDENLQQVATFHTAWLEQISESRRAGVRALMCRMFPRIDAAFNRQYYGGYDGYRQMKLNCADFYPVYFGFGVPESVLSRAEADQLIGLAVNADQFSEAWAELKSTRRQDGHSKARELLDFISRMAGDLGTERATSLLIAILNVSENLLVSDDEAGAFSMPNQWRVSATLRRLLEVIPTNEREAALRSAVMQARGVPVALQLLRQLRGDLPHGVQMEGLEPAIIEKLQQNVAEQATQMNVSDLLDFDGQQLLIYPLIDIVGELRVRELYQPILGDPTMLLRFLEASVSIGSAHVDGDRVSRRMLNVSSSALDPIVERERAVVLVEALRQDPNISRQQMEIIDAYFRQDFWDGDDSSAD